MTEENTEPIEAVIEDVTPIEPPVATKSRKVRSEMQLKALENARPKAYKVRAEKSAIRKQIESKKTEEVPKELPIELPESYNETPIELPNELPEDLNENIKETNQEVINQETDQERIERHAERQEFN